MGARILDTLRELWASIVYKAPEIFVGLVLMLIFVMAGFGLRILIRRRLARRVQDQLLVNFISRIVFLVFLIIGVVIFLNYLGWGKAVSGLLAGAGVSAIIIGFAFKDIGENFLAGFFLAFSRPFSVGDVIEIEGMVGTVNALNFRNTHVRTFDGRDVFVPNALLIKNMLTNYTRDGLMRHDFILGIDYGDNLTHANEVILEVLNGEKNLELSPGLEPFVIIQNFDTSTVNLKVHFWTNSKAFSGSVLHLKSKTMRRVVERLLEEGFTLPADIVELKIYKNDQAIPVSLVGKVNPDTV